MKLDAPTNNKDYIFGPETTTKEFKRKEFVLAPGKTEKYLYYVISGTIGSFIEHGGEEICTGFHTKGNFFSEYSSFVTQEKSKTYSRALQKATLAMVRYEVLQKDYELSIEHQKRGRQISEKLFIMLQERNIDMLTLNAEERYLKFIRTRQEEIKQVPLKYIASYLGMTPVSLSRIRKNLNS